MNKGLLGAELKRARLAANLTQNELAHKSGVDLIDDIETGARELDIEELFKLAYALGIEADDLVKRVWQKTQSDPDL